MFASLKNVFGLALVLAATSGVAFAQTTSTGVPPNTGSVVPEIDPASVASALTLLCGGVLMLTDKLRK